MAPSKYPYGMRNYHLANPHVPSGRIDKVCKELFPTTKEWMKSPVRQAIEFHFGEARRLKF